MVATRALSIDINRLRAVKEQVDTYLRDPEPTYLATTVIDQTIEKTIAVPSGYKGALNFTSSYHAALALLEHIAPGARVDVSTREEVSGFLKNKKTKQITVRVSGKAKGEETGFTGASTAASVSAEKAMLSALVNAVVDLTTRQIAAGSDGTVQSNNVAPSKRRDKLVSDAKVQSEGGDDLVKERAAASGKSRTPLLPEGFNPKAGARQAGPTTGSLKNPAAARLPRAPR
ncbi:hypothetical protein D869_gp276 [Caulobacter phage CcrRogue]|uniref:Uncharacterized protein n=1 Tax=Caulobacter phage CcrRogue TaxID=2927986 RepID=K4JSB8_9CAUD|nr:hypothetical protein D869_gp276 [Caulobacter phage CcrRogue]AFU86638.1 hypothetical protein CcrRogue_gp156 [Caulobacter phage CcrRogue]